MYSCLATDGDVVAIFPTENFPLLTPGAPSWGGPWRHHGRIVLQRRSAVGVILSLVIVTAAGPAWLGATDDGEVLFNQHCQLCHTPERVRAKRLTKEEWQQIIKDDRGWRPDPRCHDEPAARARVPDENSGDQQYGQAQAGGKRRSPESMSSTKYPRRWRCPIAFRCSRSVGLMTRQSMKIDSGVIMWCMTSVS